MQLKHHKTLSKYFQRYSGFLFTAFLSGILLVLFGHLPMQATSSQPKLLTDPFLQLPTPNSVRVVWFTEFAGSRHIVAYGKGYQNTVEATTTKLSRVREDLDSQVETQTGQNFQPITNRDIWRHEAEVKKLTPGVRLPYRVTSVQEDGKKVSSRVFTLTPTPKPGSALKILLTSDHQLKPMTSANLQKVAETVGNVDAVFFAGDLVNIPDRASEWFDDHRGGAFFPNLQGNAHYELENNGEKALYQGGEIIQSAPLYLAIGNHEVMGRFSTKRSLSEQFSDAFPRAAARQIYSPQGDLNADETWLKNHSFNTDTVEEIFTLPESNSGGEKYYAVSFGDIRLVVLYATNIWRSPKLDPQVKGKYQEQKQDLETPVNWGYGQHIFEPIAKDSQQYAWLKAELNSPQFQSAKYKIVMLHHPPHSLGENVVPAYTDPVQVIERDPDGQIQAVRYEYPREADYLIRDVMPLLEAKGVQLVFYGHSHLWNRFTTPSGMHFLETSNVGNSYGAFLDKQQRRKVPSSYEQSYAATGDPNRLEPIVPTIAPLLDDQGKPQPYIASNEITVFSIFDTATATVSSYYFDTRKPASEVVKFDQFSLLSGS